MASRLFCNRKRRPAPKCHVVPLALRQRTELVIPRDASPSTTDPLDIRASSHHPHPPPSLQRNSTGMAAAIGKGPVPSLTHPTHSTPLHFNAESAPAHPIIMHSFHRIVLYLMRSDAVLQDRTCEYKKKKKKEERKQGQKEKETDRVRWCYSGLVRRVDCFGQGRTAGYMMERHVM